MTSRAALEQSGDMQSSVLGKNTSKVSPERLNQSRHERRLLKEHAGVLLPGARVSWCMCKMRHDAKHVSVNFNSSDMRASLSGVALCGSIWICPVCSARVSEIRRAELEQALSCDAELLPVMITFTLSHNLGDKLSELLDALNDAFRKLKAGKAWLKTKERFQIEHYVTALEIMFSFLNGWHPHKHCLMWLRMSPDAFKPEELKAALNERYKRILGKHGKFILDEIGIDVRAVNGRKELNNYMSKLSMSYEISKSASKVGRQAEHYTPFQLLSLSMAGDERAGSYFKEYAQAMSGKKFIQWSHGARDFFKLDAELTDEQIVEQLDAQEQSQDDTRELIRFSKPGWYKAVRERLVSGLLRIADAGDAQAVSAFLELHEFRQDLDFEVMT